MCKVYFYFSHYDKRDLDSTRWIAKIDDDSVNDVGLLVKKGIIPNKSVKKMFNLILKKLYQQVLMLLNRLQMNILKMMQKNRPQAVHVSGARDE